MVYKIGEWLIFAKCEKINENTLFVLKISRPNILDYKEKGIFYNKELGFVLQ